MKRSTLFLLVSGIAFLHGVAYVASYAPTPLGRVPLLDAREVLDLAQAIRDGQLPAEPFYRAPLYPALIALLSPSSNPDVLLWIARAINLAALVVTAVAAAIAGRNWHGGERAGLIAGLIVAAYPVLVYFVGDAGDTNLGIAGFAVALAAAIAAPDDAVRRDRWIARPLLALAALAGATAARPQYAAPLAVAALLVLWDLLRRRTPALAGGVAFASVAVVLGGLAFANQRVGNDPMVLPWQGAYNAWAANGPDGNGRWFQQTVAVGSANAHRNPTRVESELRYQRETGSTAPPSPRENQRYWYRRLADYAREHPGAVAERLASKSWFLVNNQEQYNNKTYAVQAAESPVLRFNPLGFAMLLGAALFAAVCAPAPGGRRAGWAWLALAYAAGTVLFLVSDRFRLPLLLPLAILAGGLQVLPDPRALPRRRLAIATAVALAGVALSLVPPAPEAKPTEIEDRVLEASAAIEVGAYAEALVAARAAIALDPGDRHAQTAACVAGFNLWLSRRGRRLDPAADACSGVTDKSLQVRYLLGVLRWNQGRVRDAAEAWQVAAADPRDPAGADALAALVWIGAVDTAGLESNLREAAGGLPDVVLLSLAERGSATARNALATTRPAEWIANQRSRLALLLPPPSPEAPAPP